MDIKQRVTLLYALYAVSMVLSFFEVSMLLGLLLLAVSYILTISKKEQKLAKGTPFENHYQWANRTFWIGSLYILIATIISGYLVFTFTSTSSILEAYRSGDTDLMLSRIQAFTANETSKTMILAVIPMIPVAIWWLNRCWKGYKHAAQSLPVENVKSWL